MRRLFTFGCSYSQYVWSMWPNVLGQSFDYTENFGKSGSGNLFIFYRLIYCSSIRELTSDDTVVVQWSGPSRFDHLHNGNGMWNSSGDTSAEEFVYKGLDHYNSDPLVTLKQLTYMIAAAKLLNSTGAKWYFMFLNEHSKVHTADYTEKYNLSLADTSVRKELDYMQQYVRDSYSDHLIDETGMYEYMMKTFGPQPWRMWYRDINDPKIEFTDCHPIPSQSLSFIRNIAGKKMPNLDYDAMETYVAHVEKLLFDNAVGTMEDKAIYNPIICNTIFDSFDRKIDETGFKWVTNQYYHGK